jgi:hypothetical protein
VRFGHSGATAAGDPNGGGILMTYLDLTEKRTGAALRIFLDHVIYMADLGSGVTKIVLDNREDLEIAVSYPAVIQLMAEQMEQGDILRTG